MRVAYIYIGAVTAGVHKKLLDKVSNMNSIPEINVQLFQVASSGTNELENTIDAQSTWATSLSKWPILWRLSILFQQQRTYSTIKKHFNGYPFDLIMMRYPGADFFLWYFLRSSNIKIVFEHNTLELEELKLRAQGSYWYKYFYWGERIFGKWTRGYAAGHIGVTKEIADRQAKLSKSRTPLCVISNGINLDRIPIRNGPPFQKGHQLNVLFLAGSEAPWHGIDILLNSIETYAHQDQVHCCIAGNVNAELKARISNMPNVVHCPTVVGPSLDKLIEESHVGIGSLALFGKQMREASTLKVREYWARALPFVIGHCDTDVMSCPEASVFCLNLEMDGSTGEFDFQKVVTFASQVYADPKWKTYMQVSAKKHIDYRVKAAQYAEFLKLL